MNGFEMILPFLKPIEHLILDGSISEVMVNGSEHVFIERNGFLERVPNVAPRRQGADGCGQEYRPTPRRRHLGIETHSRLPPPRRQPCCRRDPSVQSGRCDPHDP